MSFNGGIDANCALLGHAPYDDGYVEIKRRDDSNI